MQGDSKFAEFVRTIGTYVLDRVHDMGKKKGNHITREEHAALVASSKLLPLDPVLQRGLFPVRFRALACEFRGNPSSFDDRFRTQAGDLVIEAVRSNALPALEGLRELVDFHSAPDEPRPPNRQAVLVRCSSNLFLDIAGGAHVTARIDATGAVSTDGKTFGGLLPRLGLLPHSGLAMHEREARACEVLAELADAVLRTATGAKKAPVHPAFIAMAILLYKPDISPTLLASMVGVSKSTLYSNSKLWKGVAKTLRARPSESAPRGAFSENGSIDAYDDRSEIHDEDE